MSCGLPFYEDIREQEHRKLYAHGAVPLWPTVINFIPAFQKTRSKNGLSITTLNLIDFKTGATTDILAEVLATGLYVSEPDLKNYDLIIYPGTIRIPLADFSKGGYYLEMSDGVTTWYSEVFTMMDNLTDFIRVEWCHNRDFVFSGSAGHIEYTNEFGTGTGYKNYLWINTDLVKPKYLYDRDVKDRDGIVFPLKQIKKKVQRFEYIGPESIIDQISNIELHDVVKVFDKFGRELSVNEFTMGDPDWFTQGNIGAVTIELVLDSVIVSVYGNGLTTGQTCEVSPGTCIAPTGNFYAVKSHLTMGGSGWVDGQYYNSEGVLTNLIAGDYVTAGADGVRRIYTFNAPNDYTVESTAGFYTKVYYENTNEYWYDRGEGLNVRKSKITGFTDLTVPPTFYGQAGNEDAIYELWLEDYGGAEVFVKTTSNSELNLGEEIDSAGYEYLHLKTVTVKCGVIMDHKFMIPLSYLIFSNADGDSTAIVTNADGLSDTIVGGGDLPSVPVP